MNNQATADIENELAKLQPQEEKGDVKASLFNLIVYTICGKQATHYKERVRSLIEKFPCRIMFIECDQDKEEDFLQLKVTTERLNHSPIVCDQIYISCSKSQMPKVPFLILPNVISDLPLYLLWGQDPLSETVILPELIHYADRLVFDSECYDNLQEFCSNMLAKIGALPTVLVDINWAIFRGWRKLLAQAFDTEPKIAELKKCKYLAITYNDIKSDVFRRNETQCIYMVGWLASRLKWKILSIQGLHEATRILCKTQDGECSVSFCSEFISDLQPGAILNIAFDFGNSNSMFFERKEQQKRVNVHVSSKDICEMPFSLPLPDLNKGIDFIKEVFHKVPSKDYREMLKKLESK